MSTPSNEDKPLVDRSIGDLLRLYSGILSELRRRGIVRTNNAPTGDLAEFLVAQTLQGRLQTNSAKGGDVLLPSGKRIQVKARIVTGELPGERQLSPFRTFDFDEAAIVLFDGAYGIRRAVRIPMAQVQVLSVYRKHVNGHILQATDGVLNSSTALDFTTAMRATLLSLV